MSTTINHCLHYSDTSDYILRKQCFFLSRKIIELSISLTKHQRRNKTLSSWWRGHKDEIQWVGPWVGAPELHQHKTLLRTVAQKGLLPSPACPPSTQHIKHFLAPFVFMALECLALILSRTLPFETDSHTEFLSYDTWCTPKSLVSLSWSLALFTLGFFQWSSWPQLVCSLGTHVPALHRERASSYVLFHHMATTQVGADKRTELKNSQCLRTAWGLVSSSPW